MSMIRTKAEALKHRQAQIAKVRAEHSAVLYKVYDQIHDLHVPVISKLKVREGIDEMLSYLGSDPISTNKANKLIKKS